MREMEPDSRAGKSIIDLLRVSAELFCYNKIMKSLIITGVGTGIGEALTRKYLSEGHKVYGTYFGEKPLEKKNLTLFPLDLSQPESIKKCADEIGNIEERVDIMINNAGVLFDEEETSVVVEKLRRTMEINLLGTVDFTERLIHKIKSGGHIINISSTAGSLELAGPLTEVASHFPYHYPAYKISKAALNMYTRTLSSRVKDDGITVSSVHPGWIRTEMGGDDAAMSPNEAADSIYEFSLTSPESGNFWFKGNKLPW